jgi:DNA-binding transcriptional ArsR family regulator
MESLAALSDPTRRRIVELLGTGERSSGEIGAHFAVSAPAISQHLKVLRDARLVRVRTEGQRRIYALDPDGLAAIDRWLAVLRPFWADRLDALADELAREAAEEPAKPGDPPPRSPPRSSRRPT